jgi:general stress protein YciG
MGRKRGRAMVEEGVDFEVLGASGGRVTQARYGREHYVEAGRRGGQGGRAKPKPRNRKRNS